MTGTDLIPRGGVPATSYQGPRIPGSRTTEVRGEEVVQGDAAALGEDGAGDAVRAGESQRRCASHFVSVYISPESVIGEAMVERAVPILPGDDLRVAKDFYVDKLGFQVQFEATADGKEGIMGLERGTIEITIDCPMSGHGRNACASLRVASADFYYEEWRQTVEMSRPPMNEPWGGRTFGFQDPFGNSIFVIGPVVE